MSRLIDYEYHIECGSFSLQLNSFENDGIRAILYFGNGHTLDIQIYNELTEKFSSEYRTLCLVFDPFIVEQLENHVKLCFTK